MYTYIIIIAVIADAPIYCKYYIVTIMNTILVVSLCVLIIIVTLAHTVIYMYALPLLYCDHNRYHKHR